MIESRILLALFNGAWQSGLVCAIAFLLMRANRRLNATNVHGIWNVLLCISVALPVANYAFTKPAHTVAQPAVTAHAAFVTPVRHAVAAHSVAPAVVAQPRIDPSQMWFDAELFALRHARTALLIMALLALLKLAFLGRDLAVMLRLRRRVRPVDLPFQIHSNTRRGFSIASTNDLRSPCVLGFAAPLVVVPGALLEEEHQERLRDVLLHEVAHIDRWDDVQNFLHRAIAAVLFFDPGVMVALHELALAREAACDDAVLAARNDRIAYATTLSGMAMWVRRHSVAVPSLVFGKKQLLRRVEQLLDRSRNHSIRENRPLTVTALLAVVLAAYALVHVQVPAVAQTVASVQKHLGMATHKAITAVAEAPRPSYNARLLEAAAQPEASAPKATVQPSPKLAIKKVERKQIVTKRVVAQLTRGGTPEADAPIAVPSEDANSAITAAAPRAVTATVGWSHGTGAAPHAKVDLLDALDAGGYKNLSPDELIKLTNHGVNACLIETAGQTFARRPSVDELVSMADNGVSCTYIRDLSSYGLRALQPAQLIHLAQQGVSVPFAAVVLKDIPGVTMDDITRLAQHGVSGAYLDGLRSMHYGVSVDQAIKLVDHGVGLRTIQKLNRSRTSPLSVDDLVRLVDAGVTGE